MRVRTVDIDAARLQPGERVGEVGRPRHSKVFDGAFGDADGRHGEAGIGGGRTEERAVEAEERGAPKNRSDVVRVSHSVKGDCRAARSGCGRGRGEPARCQERIGELRRRRPAARLGEDAEALVVGRPGDAIQLGVARLDAGDAALCGPPREVRHRVPHRVRVHDAQDVVAPSLEDRHPGVNPLDDIAGVGGGPGRRWAGGHARAERRSSVHREGRGGVPTDGGDARM